MEFFGIKAGEWTPAADTELDSRTIRRMVSEFNDTFGMDDKHKYYILSSMAGYRLTCNLKEIRAAIEHDEKIARAQLWRIGKHKGNLENMEYWKKHGKKERNKK